MSVIFGLPYLDAPSITCLPFFAFLPFSPSNYKRKETSISFQMFHMNILAEGATGKRHADSHT